MTQLSLTERGAFLALVLSLAGGAAQAAGLTLEAVKRAPAAVVGADGAALKDVRIVREWEGAICSSRVVNGGATPARVREVVLFEVPHDYPPETRLYGEGFTMLSQTAGTLGKPADLGLTDRKHYRIPQPTDATTVYGLLTLSPPGGEHLALAFASCRRFVGRFHVRPKSIQAVVDTEGLTLAPGESWKLEKIQFGSGKDRNALLAALAERIRLNHPPLRLPTVPTGWCSWYCFGARVKA
ncbi:MAG TPA: hypothetical protein VFE78_15050, partial [Gemmataceae bacterium]|nr:hypothetical protein [Gemmataceae bacterium]